MSSEIFKPTSWQKETPDLVKEYEAWDASRNAPEEVPERPEEFSKALVRRGVLDPRTGRYGGNSKQEHISRFVPSRAFLENFELIQWDTLAVV